MEKYRQAIQKYYLDITNTDLKETPRKEKFLALLKDLFPNCVDEIQKYTDGSEAGVKIHVTGSGIIKNGRIDAFFGDLIIEFERSIPTKRSEAERQLREYCAGLWSAETRRRPYICIATDGVTWITYYPESSTAGNLAASDIELTEKEFLSLSGDPRTYDDFFLFINRIFFREGRLKPTTENFKKDFGLGSYLFESIQRELTAVFRAVKAEEEIALSYSEWSRYLTYTYGSVATNEALFVKHTYLSILARFIVWAALAGSSNSGTETSSALIESLISGSHFQRIGILNLAEKDFFHWVGYPPIHAKLEGLWLRVLNQLRTYDFAEIHEDVLKGVYQELVDPADRHDLGEYYTPDWLCEKIVDSLIGTTTKGIPSVIDLTCGSGSFLRAAIHRIQKLLQSKFPSATVNWQSVLVAILSNVHGVDIHPLAVIISKANYVLAIKDLLVHRRKPVRLPIFLADSLLMPQVEEALLFDKGSMVLSFSGQKYRFPPSFFGNPRVYDDAIDLASAAAENMAKDEHSESEEGFSNSLMKVFREYAGEDEVGDIARELFRLSKHLADKIRRKENTIWSYILRNTYKPVFLHQKYDLVIGNPPWLSYRYVSDPVYQSELKYLGVEKYKVAPTKQKLITQMEIATIFLVHATANYLKKDGRLAFVMPRSVFSADQHERFRAESFDAECDITEYWDLDGVSPLFNVPSCVVFAKRKKKPEPNESYNALFLSGRLPTRDLPLAKAAELLEEKKGRLYLSKMGERTALSRKKICYNERALHYKDRFFQGATIVPRNFYFIAAPVGNELGAEELFARTDPEQAKEGKLPYRDIFLEGSVEKDFVFRTALAKHILPFHVCELPYVLLPVLKEKDGYRLVKAQELRDKGYRGIAEWFSRAESEWNRARGNKADRQDLYQRLNYQNELMKQDPEADHIVLYNTAGTNISAALLELRTINSPFFADHMSYWTCTQIIDEGFYLCSVLNSDIINTIVKPFQSRGLLGERHLHKKVLEIPIPQFDRKDPIHSRLAALGKECTAKVRGFSQSGELKGTLAAKRAKVRNLLSVEMKEMSRHVRKILDG